jgi:hypothetical protein
VGVVPLQRSDRPRIGGSGRSVPRRGLLRRSQQPPSTLSGIKVGPCNSG